MDSGFIGRQSELALVDNIWESSKAALLILYGRRRVGKTRLLIHWLQQHNGQGLYWMAEPTSALDQLRSFSQALANFADPETEAPLDFTYANWEQALRQVSLLAREQRIAVFIDEVTYLMDVNPAIIGVLQKAWDHWLKNSNLVLALSGSQMGLMQKQLLSYQAPLYGRATAQVKLPPLPFGVTGQFFPGYSAADRVAIYAIWGGIPAYWERIDTSKSILENLSLQLQPSNAWMMDESRILLQDFINDPHNYVGIMRAIAHGEQTLSGIGRRTGLSGGHASKYLSILRDTGFVERRVPVTEFQAADSRRGRYFVTDPYLRFYYRFLAAYQSKLALGHQKQLLETIEQNLPEFIETNTWQELCREWLLLASAHDEVPVPVEHVGSEWKRSHAFDVVGISEDDHSLILGTCHWGDEPAGIEAIEELVRRTSSIAPRGEEWQVYYIGFAAGGWTEEAQACAETVVTEGAGSRARRKWQAVGVRLIDLAELDSDLTRWSSE